MDLLRPSITTTGIAGHSITEHRPTAPVTPGMPVIIPVQGTADLIDLDKSLLRVRGKILTDDDQELGYNEPVGPTNHLLAILWRNFKLSLNQVLVNDNPDKMYGYLAYFDDILEQSTKQEKSQLQNELFIRDTPGTFENLKHMLDSKKATNVGLYKRAVLTRGSGNVEMSGALHFPLRKANKVLYNFIDLLIRLEANDQEIILLHDIKENGELKKYKFKLHSVEYLVYRIAMTPNLAASYRLGIAAEKGIRYTYIKPEIKRYPIRKDQLNVIVDNVFNNRVPFAYLVVFVDSDAFHGKFNKNPFLFKDQAVSDIIPSINGHITKPMRDINITNYESQECYQNLVDFAAAISGLNTYSGIEIFDLRLGYCFFGTRLLSIDSEMTAKGVIPSFERGTFKLELRFRNHDERVNFEMLVVGYFNETMLIDPDRNVSIVETK